ncbi:MAG TPA: hypothetical protein VF510_12195 [Ktedonobacterales bacterium]
MSLRFLRLLTYIWWIFVLAEFAYFGAGSIVEMLTEAGATHGQRLWTVFHPPHLSWVLLPVTALTWGISRVASSEIKRRTRATAGNARGDASGAHGNA